jgi:hypothetical protein
MADMADAVRVGISITLVVPGALISGGVESAQDFYKAMADRHRQGVAEKGDPTQDDVANKLAETFFDKPAEAVQADVQKERDAFEKGEIPTPGWPMERYIHLRSAKYVTPGQHDISLDHVRILLSQVVGWTVGEFGTSS